MSSVTCYTVPSTNTLLALRNISLHASNERNTLKSLTQSVRMIPLLIRESLINPINENDSFVNQPKISLPIDHHAASVLWDTILDQLITLSLPYSLVVEGYSPLHA